jgi:extracellular matrix protein 14
MSAKAGIIAYTIELRDTGSHGFLLPKKQIIPMGKEIWEAMKVFVEVVLEADIRSIRQEV